jgi:hypothetical protein
LRCAADELIASNRFAKEKNMSETTSGKSVSILQLILIPSLITLGVTLVRLIGELKHWPTALFNPAPGGAGAIVGISWLPLLFGIYFAIKLSDAGQGPQDRGRTVRLSIVGVALLLAGVAISAIPQLNVTTKVVVAILLALAAVGLQYAAWPRLFKVLLAYGYAARIPVLILMYFAIRGNWGTHYDVVPPGFAADTPFWSKFMQIAFLPQMIFWIVYTIITGSLAGSIAIAIARRGKPREHAVSA